MITPSFLSKRPSKKLAAVLLLITALIVVFSLRNPIVSQSIEYFAKPLAKSQNLYVTCLDFSFDWRLNIKVKHVCLSSPMGNIELHGATWQPWSNDLGIQQIKIEHIKPRITDNKINDTAQKKQQTDNLNFVDSLPKLSIESLEIDSYQLLHPIRLAVKQLPNNTLSITGDVNASLKVSQNTIMSDIEWRISDLIKWSPQAQVYFQDHAELLKDLAVDESNVSNNHTIKTSLIFNGEELRVDSQLNINSLIHVPKCSVNIALDGNLSMDIDINSFHSSLDLSQLTSVVSVNNCPLLADYFVENELPKLSFILPQKITLGETHINLPELQIIGKQVSQQNHQQMTHQSITLNAVNYKTTGELEVNYNISLKQPVKTKTIEAEMLNFQAAGSVSVDFSTVNTQQPINFKLVEDNNRLEVSALKLDALLVGNLTADMAFSGVSPNDLKLNINSQISQLQHPDLNIQNITNHIDVNILKFETISFSAHSAITNLLTQDIHFLPIDIEHRGQLDLTNMNMSSQHKINLEQGFSFDLEHQQTQANVHIPQQEITRLHSIISQLDDTLVIKEGGFSANIKFTLPRDGEQFVAKGKVDIQKVSAKYQDYVLNDMTYQTPLVFDSAGLQLTGASLYIDSIDAGVMIEHIEASVMAQDNQLRLKQVQGEIFNGKFSFDNFWLDGRDQQFNVNFQNIDLTQIVALQQQPGIHITGNINGDMPLIMDKHGIRIEDGWLSSLAGGKLTIIDNPSFDSIKEQQPQLALLENLDFTHLESNVRFTPDGWVFFDFALQGNNPDKNQAVNFNYSHEENIFSLLESIRLVKSVENRIEQKITQGETK